MATCHWWAVFRSANVWQRERYGATASCCARLGENRCAAALAALPDLKACARALERPPAAERDFKRLFDEYSEGISYKQQYRDKNAFLVYYTQGFDGAGRPSIETEDAAEVKQKAQFGARNEAWLGVDDARAEARYLLEHPPPPGDEGELKELKEALRRAQAATASYLALAPDDQVRAAREATQGAVR